MVCGSPVEEAAGRGRKRGRRPAWSRDTPTRRLMVSTSVHSHASASGWRGSGGRASRSRAPRGRQRGLVQEVQRQEALASQLPDRHSRGEPARRPRSAPPDAPHNGPRRAPAHLLDSRGETTPLGNAPNGTVPTVNGPVRRGTTTSAAGTTLPSPSTNEPKV